MKLCMEHLLGSISTALDVVEGELLGASTNHGKRIATLCAAMARHLGLEDTQVSGIASSALLHDNALTEYILSEQPGGQQEMNMRIHCELGERNMRSLPFYSHVQEYVLYHHEQPNGAGPFGKQRGEFPLGAAIIAAADMVDAQHHLQRFAPAGLPALREGIRREAGARFVPEAAAALAAVLNEEMLLSLRDESIEHTFLTALACWNLDLDATDLVRLAGMAGRIIDYKSHFTRTHSAQIACKAWWMAGVYGLEGEERAQVYLAAALHDLGKLMVPTEILEKPGALTDDEFGVIKSHAYWTHALLKDIDGLENVCRWASSHHRKLDGGGYPDVEGGEWELDFISRLLGCIDIYQAVREARPYHPARTHAETMEIMYGMAEKGQIDSRITKDLDREMQAFPDGVFPPPPGGGTPA